MSSDMAAQGRPVFEALKKLLAVSQRTLLVLIIFAVGFLVALSLYPIDAFLKDSGQRTESRLQGSPSAIQICQAWFEESDRLNGDSLTGRDFDEDPITIYDTGMDPWFKPMKSYLHLDRCDIPCRLVCTQNHSTYLEYAVQDVQYREVLTYFLSGLTSVIDSL
jgi:hypothetical protein